MKRYRYSYQCLDRYDTLVTFCQFLTRCTPCDTPSQRVKESNFYILNAASVEEDVDCFGNVIHYGMFKSSHDIFVVSSVGVVECEDQYMIEDSTPHSLFLTPTPLTSVDGDMTLFNQGIEMDVECDSQASVASVVVALSQSIYDYMEYTPGATSVDTTARESFALGKGVCQDYSHLLIALCRERGILVRYVAGFVVGEGETHAWVEFWSDGVWRGVDPTHNKLIEGGYIKVAHGRDASDCSIVRGVRRGVTRHTSQVRVVVDQI